MGERKRKTRKRGRKNEAKRIVFTTGLSESKDRDEEEKIFYALKNIP